MNCEWQYKISSENVFKHLHCRSDKLCGRRRVRPTWYSPARVQCAITQFHRPLWVAVTVLLIAPTTYTKFEVRTRHTFGFSINRPGDLDLWPFDLEPDAHYCPSGGQPPILVFLVPVREIWRTSRSELVGLVTLTFDLNWRRNWCA